MKTSNTTINNESGATIVFVAATLALLIMFTALAIDVGHLYAVRNELHDAADAGALAGASVLFNSDGTLNRDAALAEGTRVTEANKSGNLPVTEKTVETGHWSFSTKTFTASEATEQIVWQGNSFAALDVNPAFINAVRVKADRSDTPSFFAKIFGFDQFFVSNDAVAYIGFAGDLHPDEIDQPIALCEDTITQNGALNCNMGRMLNSGGNPGTSMTAMWTNYTQNPCSTASSSDMQNLTDVCGAGNPNSLTYDVGIGTQNGVQDSVFGNITDCWLAAADSDKDGVPDISWSIRLPVVKCGVDNTCEPYRGAVLVNVVWIIHKNDPISQMKDVPLKMDDWSCSITPATRDDRFSCWKEFVDHFNLQNVTGEPSSDADYEEMYQKKNIFFLPECERQIPTGNSGGMPFNVLAKYPKLVE